MCAFHRLECISLLHTYTVIGALLLFQKCPPVPVVHSFGPTAIVQHEHVSPSRYLRSISRLGQTNSNQFCKQLSQQVQPTASLVGHVPEYNRPSLEQALTAAGLNVRHDSENDNQKLKHPHFEYSFSRATGMLKLESTMICSPESQFSEAVPPKWIPLVKNMENILVSNGWSFLDPDDSEDISAFDLDAANLEGQYKPSWGIQSDNDDYDGSTSISKLGFSLQRMSEQEIQAEAFLYLNGDLAHRVLLEGATDPPHVKETHNGCSFRGSVQNVNAGLFFCALGGIPLFSTHHLSPSTASSGWLSFSQPVSEDHIQLIYPNINAPDQRIEVTCAKTGCHLGHYFGKGNGYCINASVLNFITETPFADNNSVNILSPHSWWTILQESPFIYSIYQGLIHTKTVLLGAGCFWHVEYAVRRLPGIVSTMVGYAGGNSIAFSHPTYQQVCTDNTGHAEVVSITFDPTVLDPRILFDCFLALHDPTKVRAHGKHAQQTGQYRSCIFIDTIDGSLVSAAHLAMQACRLQLEKDLATEIQLIPPFWIAEERHQRHDECRNPNVDTSTMPSVQEWLKLYGQRSPSIVGSASTINSLTSM